MGNHFHEHTLNNLNDLFLLRNNMFLYPKGTLLPTSIVP